MTVPIERFIEELPDNKHYKSCIKMAELKGRNGITVPIKRFIEEIRDSKQYRGYIKIADRKFDFELVFEIPIMQLRNLNQTKVDNEIQRVVQIILKRDGVDIELTFDEYVCFFAVLVTMAFRLYGTSMSFGILNCDFYDLPPKFNKILSSSKFGCDLVA